MMRTLALALALLAPLPAQAAELILNYTDPAGSGFFDPSPITQPPGSSATTVGQARRVAFQFAAALLGSRLHSLAPIRVNASMSALDCDASGAVLGRAGPSTVHQDFPGAPAPRTWYVQALANSLASAATGRVTDLDPNSPDINAQFNGAIDDASCLGSVSWFYGIGGSAPAGSIDFATIVVHELAHGLGLVPVFDPSTGAEAANLDDAYELRLEQHGASPSLLTLMTDVQRTVAASSEPNLHWLGPAANALAASTLTAGVSQGHLVMFAPNPQQPGSSVSHLSSAVTPNNLFEPAYTGLNHDVRLALALLQDLGWRAAAPVPALGAHRPLLLLLLALFVAAAARRCSLRAIDGPSTQVVTQASRCNADEAVHS
jgi:hypothetical protein